MASSTEPDTPVEPAPPSSAPSSHSSGSDTDIDVTVPDTRAASEPPSTDPRAAASSPVSAPRSGGADGHGHGTGGDSPSIVDTHASGGGYSPRFAPTTVPSPDDDPHGADYFGPDHETASDLGSIRSSNLDTDAADAARIQLMVEKAVHERVERAVHETLKNLGMGEGSGQGMARAMDGSQGGGGERVTVGPPSTTTQFRTPTPRPEPTPNTAPAPATNNTTRTIPFRYQSNNPRALSYHNTDIAAVEKWNPSHSDTQKLVKQAMEAAKHDSNVDFAINPTFTADLTELATEAIGQQRAIPAYFVLGHGLAAFLRERGLGMDGMFGDQEDTSADHTTQPVASQPHTYRRQPFGKSTSLPPTVSHTGYLDFQQPHFRTYDSQDEMKNDLDLTTMMASTFTDTLGGPSEWRDNLEEYDAMEKTAETFKACDRAILRLMIAILKAMDEKRKVHDFSQLKNLLTSATEMLRMDPKTVHTTPHVRPSVCDVLFNVSLPGLNTMLATKALLRSSSPSNVLKAIVTCITPQINPYCSLSEAEEVYRRQLDTLSSTVGVRDLLPDDIQVLLWAAILAQLDQGHVSSWGQAFLAYQKSVTESQFNPQTAQLQKHDLRRANATNVLGSISTAHRQYGGERDAKKYKSTRATSIIAYTAAQTDTESEDEGTAAAGAWQTRDSKKPPSKRSPRTAPTPTDTDLNAHGHVKVSSRHKRYKAAMRMLVDKDQDGRIKISNKLLTKRYETDKLDLPNIMDSLEVATNARHNRNYLKIKRPSTIDATDVENMNTEELAIYMFLSGSMDESTRRKRDTIIEAYRVHCKSLRDEEQGKPHTGTIGTAISTTSTTSTSKFAKAKFDTPKLHAERREYTEDQTVEITQFIKAATDDPNATTDTIIQTVTRQMKEANGGGKAAALADHE